MKISIVIPSFKRLADLNRALLALCQQERAVDEVLVVSRVTDLPTQELALSFVDKLPVKVVLVRMPGVVEAYNSGIESATGEIIAFQDDDAAAHADWLRRIEDAFQRDGSLAGIGGRDRIIRHPQIEPELRYRVGVVFGGFRVVGNHHCGTGSARPVDTLKAVNMAFRRSFIQGNRLDNRLRGTGAQVHCELKFCLDLRKQGKRLVYDPSILVDHFVAARHDEDQRDSFNALAYENAMHNLTYTLLCFLSPLGKFLMLCDALFFGMGTAYFGVAQSLRYLPRIGTLSFRKLGASWRGVFAGLHTWLRSR